MAGLCLAASVLGCTHTEPFIAHTDWSQPASTASEAKLAHRLFLIGDAGGDAADRTQPILDLLAQQASAEAERSTVVFLGDNVYPRGVPAPCAECPEAETVLRQAAVASRSGARVVFVTGNHDWDLSGRRGAERVLEQGRVIREGQAGAELRPPDACPGPDVIPLGDGRLRLVALDTEWLLRRGRKPTSECPAGSAAAVERQLAEALAAPGADWRVVVAHHPIATTGEHSGFYDWKVHLFGLQVVLGQRNVFAWLPLPVVGTLVAGVRGIASPTAQDLSNPKNRRMRAGLERAMAEAAGRGAPTDVYAAGHDHSLQVMEGKGGVRLTVVSGLSFQGHATGVGHDDRTLFAHASDDLPGFMVLDFLEDGSATLEVIGSSEEGPVESFRMLLPAGVGE
jgi:hypothetical protein